LAWEHYNDDAIKYQDEMLKVKGQIRAKRLERCGLEDLDDTLPNVSLDHRINLLI
jgi:hypothetical protein